VKSLLISGLYFPPMTGGISNYMASVAAALGPAEVCCLTGIPSHGNGPRAMFPIRSYRRPAAFAKAKHVQAVGFGAAIAEIMLRERPHVVQLATAYDGYMGLWLRRWLKLPFVVYAHGNEILDALGSTWPKPRLSLKQAARVLANSRFTAQLVEKAGVAPHRIEIIHPGCDVDRFQPYESGPDLRQRMLGQKASSRVILSVGNLVARKGHDMVISALPRLLPRMPDVVYLIIGEGPYRSQLENLATSLGVRERVIFAGRIADEHLPEIYALSDVFIMPSREHLDSCDVEGFGMVFLEASACAKPTIAGRSGGIGDAVVDGVTGLLVDPLDVDDIAAALWIILSNRELAIQLGHQGRSRVVSDFAWPRIADRVQQILESVVAEKSDAGGEASSLQ
jgi:phosphatidyl-myo-inositol dimannoside synthase